MTRLQASVTALAALLFVGLYFGFDIKPNGRAAVDAQRAIEGSSTDASSVLEEALKKISAEQAAEISKLQTAAEAVEGPEKAELMKKVSSAWFADGQLAAAGIWAERAAELEKTDAAWSVAGATFHTALTKAANETERQFCGKKAVRAFESAVSLAPSSVEHQVNLASVLADFPPPDNPMKAVLMLRELETKNPENALVLNALGRLALKTGQWDRAVQRFEKSLAADPANLQAACLVIEAYERTGQTEKAAAASKKCEALRSKNH